MNLLLHQKTDELAHIAEQLRAANRRLAAGFMSTRQPGGGWRKTFGCNMRALIPLSLVMLLLGCATRTSRVAVVESSVSVGDYLLIVATRGETKAETCKAVDAEGNISMPFGVTVRAAGMPVDLIGQSIENAYKPICFGPPLKVSVSRSR